MTWRNPRQWMLVALLASTAMFNTGCYVEQRADGQWWACTTVQTAGGPVEGCQPIQIPGLTRAH